MSSRAGFFAATWWNSTFSVLSMFLWFFALPFSTASSSLTALHRVLTASSSSASIKLWNARSSPASFVHLAPASFAIAMNVGMFAA